MSTVRGSGAWYSETYCIKTLSRDSVFIRSYQKLEIGDIRNIMCLSSSSSIFLNGA